jgi:hypothetical protein
MPTPLSPPRNDLASASSLDVVAAYLTLTLTIGFASASVAFAWWREWLLVGVSATATASSFVVWQQYFHPQSLRRPPRPPVKPRPRLIAAIMRTISIPVFAIGLITLLPVAGLYSFGSPFEAARPLFRVIEPIFGVMMFAFQWALNSLTAADILQNTALPSAWIAFRLCVVAIGLMLCVNALTAWRPVTPPRVRSLIAAAFFLPALSCIWLWIPATNSKDWPHYLPILAIAVAWYIAYRAVTRFTIRRLPPPTPAPESDR